MRLIQIGLPLLDYMGSCYGRSPPEGAGWEAAGRTSMPMENHGSVMPKETQLRSKGSTHRFTLWTIYIMMTRRVMTTCTILTTATTFTLWMIFQYHRQLRYIRSHAATKIDALSGELLEDIENNPLSNVDYPHGNLNNKKLEGISACKDTSLRTHGGHNPNPLMRPKPAAQKRLASQSRRFSQGYNQLRFVNKPAAVPVPTGFQLQFATWNVEGLRETAKYDQIITFLNSKQIHLLAVQETKCESVSTFCKSGWEILHSGSCDSRHHGVGLFVSPSLRPHAHKFLAHSPRICELTLQTNPHPVTVFSIYAPSTVDDPSEDQFRKEQFWSQLDSIISGHCNSSHLIILGDYNARLDSSLDHDHDHIGPHVWGKRQSIPDPDRDNAVYLMEFMQSHLLLLPQIFTDLHPSNLVSYKEMTSTTDFLDDFSVSDWTTLDFASITHPIYCDLQFKGSHFQQLINTRHLPLLFSYSSSFIFKTPTPSIRKLD